MTMLQAGFGSSGSGYQVQRSVRLRSAASAFFSRTLTAATGNPWTWSGWVQRGTLGSRQILFGATDGNNTGFGFDSADKFAFFSNSGADQLSTAVFRDPSAFGHLVVNSNGTTVNAWWNNQQIANITIASTAINTAVAHTIGRLAGSALYYFDGYLTEVNFVSGQALTPTSFGEQDITTRMWVPKTYTGVYGTNGFELDFSDITSTTTLGYDKSGNGNNWTANNISLTSGVTYDSMLDVPGLPWTDGGNGRGNYCTLNPLAGTQHAIRADMKWANMFADGSPYTGAGTMNNSLNQQVTQPVYMEVTCDSSWSLSGQAGGVGFIPAGVSIPSTQNPGSVANGFSFFMGGGAAWSKRQNGGTFTSISLSNSVAGTVMMVAYNPLTGNAWVGKDGVWNGTGNPATGANPDLTGISSLAVEPVIVTYRDTVNNCQLHVNCGQRPFAYPPPTGFAALNTANLPDPTGAAAKPWEHFDVRLWVGNGSTQNITGLAFQPDMVWPKARSAIRDNRVVDSVRGVTKSLQPNLIDAELTEVNGLTAFLSNGFSLGSQNGFNALNETHVGWCWKAGGTAVTNNSGTISSQVSANTQAGVSVVTYTGTGANATVGHGLGVVPKMVIVKRRNSTGDWPVWNQNVAAGGSDRVLFLNTTDAQTVSGTNFNSSSPTSSVINIGTSPATNASGGTYAAYCFVEVPGFSKFGSYTGNGSSEGPNIILGFEPRYVLAKRTDAAGTNWQVIDTARDTFNSLADILAPNSSAAELTDYLTVNALSNGFKVGNTDTSWNANGGTYIYAAFAESPFKYANAR